MTLHWVEGQVVESFKAVAKHTRMIAACNVIGDEVNQNAHAVAVNARDEGLEFLPVGEHRLARRG